MLQENEQALARLLELSQGGALSARKLRLFTCSRFRQEGALVRKRRPLRAVQFGEELARGTADPAQVRLWLGFWSLWLPLVADPLEAAVATLEENPWRDLPGGLALLEELLGPPELPTFQAAWRTPDVLLLATRACAIRTPLSGRMDANLLRLLSDALEEAGCADTTILDHLREGGRHPLGCWCVDLALALA